MVNPGYIRGRLRDRRQSGLYMYSIDEAGKEDGKPTTVTNRQTDKSVVLTSVNPVIFVNSVTKLSHFICKILCVDYACKCLHSKVDGVISAQAGRPLHTVHTAHIVDYFGY